MKRFVGMVALVAFLACAPDALAARCLGYSASRYVWCDDFDNYCVGGATWQGGPIPDGMGGYTWPTRCATGTSRDNSMQGNWPQHGEGGQTCLDPNDFPTQSNCDQSWDVGTVPDLYYNPPFYATYPGNVGAKTTRHAYDLTSRINMLSAGKNAVRGTDAHPLIVKVLYNFTAEDCGPNAHHYTEVCLDTGNDGKAPTNFVWQDCAPEGQGPYPTICQQDRSPYSDGAGYTGSVDGICPTLNTTRIYPSIAFGPNALLDPWPCNVGDGRKPTIYHATVFDGNRWHVLFSNKFLDPNGGDFNLSVRVNTFTLTIKSNDFIYEHDGQDTGHSQCRIPRQYTGPFNMIAHGMGGACELDPATDQCLTAYGCFNYNQNPDGNEAWFYTHIDSPLMLDGELVSLGGACCLENGDCDEMSQADCETAGGRFVGVDTTCGDPDLLCCPYPWADKEADGDVDQMDFGAFQVCYTGTGTGVPPGCDCFDRDANDKVDAGDYAEFVKCWTGANVPYKDVHPAGGCTP